MIAKSLFDLPDYQTAIPPAPEASPPSSEQTISAEITAEPQAPGRRYLADDTRREANRALAIDHVEDCRGQVLAFITARGPLGATDFELCRAVGFLADTARARRCELRDAGRVIDSGQRRQTSSGRAAVVWIAAGVMPPAIAADPPETEKSGGAEFSGSNRQPPRVGNRTAAESTEPRPIAPLRCRCGSSERREIEISGGRSRIDCAECGRFLTWGRWPTISAEISGRAGR